MLGVGHAEARQSQKLSTAPGEGPVPLEESIWPPSTEG